MVRLLGGAKQLAQRGREILFDRRCEGWLGKVGKLEPRKFYRRKGHKARLNPIDAVSMAFASLNSQDESEFS